LEKLGVKQWIELPPNRIQPL